MTLLVVADLLFNSRLYIFVDGGVLQPLLLGIPALLVMIYTVIAFAQGELLIVVLVLMYIVLIVFQLFHFGATTGRDVNVNAGLQFVWPATMVVFYVFARNNQLGICIKIIQIVSSIYTILFIVIALATKLGLLSPLSASILFMDDDERGDRLFLYPAPVLIVLFSGFAAPSGPMLRRSVTFVIMGVIALYLSLSRVLIICTIIVAVLYVAGARRFIAGWSLLIFGFIFSLYLYGMVDAGWNPFTLFAADSSGSARQWEYDTLRSFLRRDALFGLGLPGSPVDTAAVVGSEFFSSSDLGAMGVWLDMGFFGLLFFVLSTCLACFYTFRHDLTARQNIALWLTACVLGMYGSLAPAIIYGSGLYLAVIVACAVDRRPAVQMAKRLSS